MVRDAVFARALALPGKRSNGGRGTFQLILRQARSDLVDFPRDALIVGLVRRLLRPVASVSGVSPQGWR
jgi:hypothetical protein